MAIQIKPNTKWIVGRVVDVDISKGGILLAGSEVKNVTVFLLVDQVGPDVKHAKEGDVILYRQMNHVYTRDGQHLAVVIDDGDNVIGTIEFSEEDRKRLKIEGEKKPEPIPATASSS